jgi:hypothetical protein
LSVASSTDFAWGTGDFTWETWAYSTASDHTTGNNYIFDLGTGNIAGMSFYQNKFNYYNSTIGLNGQLGSFPANKWTHIAVSRKNLISYIFIDGILQGSISDTHNYGTSALAAKIGEYAGGSGYGWDGHISNLRILKGTALYTSNFTPPTRELEVIPNTVLLACQSTTNTTEEKTGKTITVTGNAVANELTPGLLTNVVKSGGSSAITGSVEFDGSGDYLSLADSGDWDIVGDYTIEFWTKLNVSDASYTDVILATGTLAGSTGFQIGVYDKDLLVRVNSTQYYNVSVGRMSYDGWNHIAAVWNGSSFKVYLNGIQVHSGTAETTSTSTSLIIGNQTDLDSNRYFNGFISNLRIIKGTALYTSNFIPPTRNLTKLPGTVLLCCQDSNDPTTEATGKTITGYGNLTDRNNIGAELVSNGTFDTDTTGWTASGSTLSIVSNKLRVTITSAYGYAYQIIPTVIGATYRVDFSYFRSTSQPSQWVQVGTSAATSTYGERVSDSAAEIFDNITFTALTTTTYITLRVNGTNVGEFSTFDNVSAKKLDPGPKQPFVPQVGSDGSVEFAGPTTINTENYFYLPTGPTEQRGRGRGIIFGGYTGPASVNNIQYVSIQSTGTAQDFGDLTAAASISGAVSSSTRAISAGGFQSPSPATYLQTIDYVTIATTGNAATFGQLQGNRGYLAGISNSTRGVFVSGYKQTPAPAATTGETDYITIASLGNTQDFGTATFGYYQDAGCSSSTRGLVAGVNNPGGGGHTTNIQYLTIATTGNTQSFGDLTVSRRGLSATSNSTRAVFCGGYTGPTSQFNVIDYVTISSTGSAKDFGDAVFAGSYRGATASSNRGIFINGYSPSLVNHIDYINISSTGNALDFGDSLITAYSPSGASDSHGGLG